MKRPSGIIYLSILLILLLPTPAGKFLIDLAGGVILVSLLIPILLIAIGWITLKSIQSKMIGCNSCGAQYSSNLYQCPLCGSIRADSELEQSNSKANIPASSATIDVTVENSD